MNHFKRLFAVSAVLAMAGCSSAPAVSASQTSSAVQEEETAATEDPYAFDAADSYNERAAKMGYHTITCLSFTGAPDDPSALKEEDAGYKTVTEIDDAGHVLKMDSYASYEEGGKLELMSSATYEWDADGKITASTSQWSGEDLHNAVPYEGDVAGGKWIYEGEEDNVYDAFMNLFSYPGPGNDDDTVLYTSTYDSHNRLLSRKSEIGENEYSRSEYDENVIAEITGNDPVRYDISYDEAEHVLTSKGNGTTSTYHYGEGGLLEYETHSPDDVDDPWCFVTKYE